MKLRLTTALILVAVLLTAFTAPVQAAYSDVTGNDWYYSAVTVLSDRGIIGGFPDGAFHPGEVLTAGQFFKMTYICSGGSTLDESGTNWSEAYFDALIDMGLVKPAETYADELNEAISRYDAARVIARYLEYTAEEAVEIMSGLENRIKDYRDIPDRYLNSVKIMYSAGIMGGYSDGSFQGKNNLIRAEAAVILQRLLDKDKRLAPPDEVFSLVGDDWFADAAFIGDSLTHGLSLQGGLSTPDFYYSTGVSVFGISSSILESPSGIKYTLNEALNRKEYKKVYILLGINELGSDSDSYYNAYSKLVDIVREQVPNASIYLQSVLPVSSAKDASSDTFTKYRVDLFNMAISKLAEDKDVKYIDVNSELADSSGFLPEFATWDGVHLNGSYYVKWADYLKTCT